MQDIIKDENTTTVQSPIETIEELLIRKIGTQKFRIWFKDSVQLSLNNGYLNIGTPNTFTAQWIERHFLTDLQSVAKTVLGQCPKTAFSVIEHPAAGKHLLASQQHLPDAVNISDSAKTRLNKTTGTSRALCRMTLESFVVGSSNELAYNAAQVVVREPHSPFNPLFIHGGYGIGKTHLLQGICNAVARTRVQTKWLYLSAEDFANQFVLALKTKKLEEFRRRIRQTELLAIDDIHFLANKPSTQEEFLHTFNTIDLAGKQVILASDAAPKMIQQLSDKLINRFVSGMVVKIEPPDFITRCKISEKCAKTMISTAFKGTASKTTTPPKVPESVIQYIAQHIRSNVRELEGALLKVVAYAALQNSSITLTLAKEVLADHVERCDPMVHLSTIESTVAAYFGTTPAVLHSSKKDKTIALARHFSMYLARKHTQMSSSEIGRLMGNKNHATVLVACKKIEDMLQRDIELHWRGPAGNRVSKTKTTLTALETNLSTS